MKKMLKRGLSLVLTLIMVVGLLPVTAFAAVDSSGRPTDLKNKLILSIYTTEGTFPGEPATHGTSEYISFKSDFTKASTSGQFKSSAESELNPSILGENVLVEGTGNGNTTVWGVFSADGLKQYFLEDASIIKPENEKKIIQTIKNCSAEAAENYEIIWYVIKLQHTDNWFSWLSTTEWHIDGIIKEKAKISINYYGNGNTSGYAPDGITDHTSGDDYVVLGLNDSDKPMKKVINGVEVAFLGWSAKADGTGEEAGFYKAGDVIKNLDKNISLYAMWDTTTQYTATVNTYLDGVLADEADIHDGERNLYLSTDEIHYHQLTRTGEGVYTTKITGNGKFHLYNKQADGTYEQVGDRQLTIYNQNGNMDVHHYSVSYDANGGAFESVPGAQNYMYGEPVTAISDIPTKEGYRFLGWKYGDKLIQPGEEVTASVTGTMTLVAQWEKTVNVTVNVTIDHTDKNNPNGYDRVPTKGDVSLDLVSRENGSPYLEVEGKILKLGNSNVPEEQMVTNHTSTFEDMPGGAVEYSVVTSKPGYDVTKVEEKKDADGNWVIDVELEYRPSNFDVTFTVEVDKESVPKEYYPQAVIVKVTYWSNVGGEWKIITQQDGNKPGVRVNLDAEGKGSGTGSYPVWKYESNGETPYGYRIEVTSFVYPDGTIVRANKEMTPDVAWTDDVYTATVQDVTGGKMFGNNLAGAYIGAEAQEGTLNAVITMDLHNVTFDAQGGKVNGQESQTVEKQYKIPSFKGYVPTREGGYVFDGWYEDANGTKAAKEGVDLTEDITLYAKWIEPLTISGTVSIAGSYKQNGVDVPVNDIDRATEAVVVLQEIRNGTTYDVDSKTVTFEYKDNNAATDYGFTGIPNDGKNYQIHVLVLNYGTTYDNESDTNNAFTPNEYTAVFGDDNVADVDAHLTFVPPSYDQPMRVDATQIGAGFRPNNVLAEVMYRDTGDLHPFKRISQHNVAPFGVQIGLTNGTGTGTQSIWKWHTDGMLYDYQMNITKVNGADYDSDTAPYYITYAAPTYWNADTNAPSGGYYDESADKYTGEMKATLIPKQYLVSFDMNAGTDTVTGMENFTQTYTNEEGEVVNGYGVVHTWSYDTEITSVTPKREGYVFLGWESNVEDASATLIDASVHQDVVLTAQWKPVYKLMTAANPTGGGTTTGDGTYDYGTEVTLTATPNEGYAFVGWFNGDKQVSEDSSFKVTVTKNTGYVAKFVKLYTVTTSADPAEGGTVSKGGIFKDEDQVTVTATPNPGYTFIGWFENDNTTPVTTDDSYSFTVKADRTLVAKFSQDEYTVKTSAVPADGGTTSGDGLYNYGTEVTLNATVNPGYKFLGWYENGTEVSAKAEYQFEVTDNRTLTANFEKLVYRVTTEANPAEGGTVTDGGTYSHGTSVTVTATANTGYAFTGWFENGTKVSEDASYSFTAERDRTLTASFIRVYTVTATATTGGTVTGGGSYNAGQSATVTAAAQEGYAFLGWFEGTERVSEDASYSFTVNADRTLTAQFSTVYTITTIAETGGSVSGGGVYQPMANATITATANGGFYFVGWYDENDELVTAKTSYSLTVKENRTFTAKFAAKVSYKCDYVYIFGYTDREIGAEGSLLRNELAQMIYRLVKQNKDVSNGGYSNSSIEGEWFQSGISYMVKVGALNETTANAPYVAVTRGETYRMICLGLGFTSDTNLSFSEYAAILRNSGHLEGDGSVTAKIARWEFCQLFNAILGRSDYCMGPDGYKDTNRNEVTAETYGYTDLKPSDPYYRTMMIATSTFKDEVIDVENRMKRNTYDFTN